MNTTSSKIVVLAEECVADCQHMGTLISLLSRVRVPEPTK